MGASVYDGYKRCYLCCIATNCCDVRILLLLLWPKPIEVLAIDDGPLLAVTDFSF